MLPIHRLLCLILAGLLACICLGTVQADTGTTDSMACAHVMGTPAPAAHAHESTAPTCATLETDALKAHRESALPATAGHATWNPALADLAKVLAMVALILINWVELSRRAAED